MTAYEMRISDWSSDVCSSDLLPIRPGSDVALMNGLLQHCREAGVVDEDYLAAHVAVPTEFWDQLGEGSDLWSVARTCDVPAADLRRFYELLDRKSTRLNSSH